MTDNEIIQALECCNNKSESCIGCPLWKLDGCVKQLQISALDLINRKNAEFEEIQAAHIRTIVEKDAEIERLQDSNRRLRDDMRMMLNNDNGSEQIKSEARKEFAERLEVIYTNDKRYDRPDAHTLLYKLFENLDNLLEEMERENNV